MAARGVHHHIAKPAVSQNPDPLEIRIVACCQNRIGDAHAFADKIQTLLVDIQHDDSGGGQPGEFDDAEADGTGADNEHGLVRFRLAALNGMTADGQRFDQGQLFESKLARDMQFAGGKLEKPLQAAIAMDAESLMMFAAIGMAANAGIALLAIDVGLDGAVIAGPNIADAGPTASTSTPSSWPGMRG
jgi:hypothetical protein